MTRNWQRFHWSFDKSFDALPPVLPPFIFRTAESIDFEALLKVVSSALLMERAWTGSATTFSRNLEKRCEQVLSQAVPACIVVQHGPRIIGASVLDVAEDAEDHLITGPCILHEYRSRGLGSALLQQSLERLREVGLKHVTAIARVNSTAARFVYPKFGSIAEPLLETPPLAA